jgi:hypothetical protein
MLVGLIFTSVTLTSLPLLCPGSRNNLVASVEVGFLPLWGRHQNASTAGHTTIVDPASQEASR